MWILSCLSFEEETKRIENRKGGFQFFAIHNTHAIFPFSPSLSPLSFFILLSWPGFSPLHNASSSNHGNGGTERSETQAAFSAAIFYIEPGHHGPRIYFKWNSNTTSISCKFSLPFTQKSSHIERPSVSINWPFGKAAIYQCIFSLLCLFFPFCSCLLPPYSDRREFLLTEFFILTPTFTLWTPIRLGASCLSWCPVSSLVTVFFFSFRDQSGSSQRRNFGLRRIRRNSTFFRSHAS